jgi:hypothetical protein
MILTWTAWGLNPNLGEFKTRRRELSGTVAFMEDIKY